MGTKRKYTIWLIGTVLGIIITLLIFIFILNNRRPADEQSDNHFTSWVYVTNELELLVSPTEKGATCSLHWLNDNPKTLTFYTINETGDRRTLSTTIDSTTCTLAEDIATLNYIGITINGKDAGGLEPPGDGSAGVASMHAFLTLPDNPTTLYPTSGRWKYQLTASSGNLSCVTSVGGISADGSVDFITTHYGMTANFSTGSAALFFTRAGYAIPHYDTPHYSTAYGSVEYDLDVLDQESMKGTLHMQGDVCAGDFPIAMTLEAPSVPPIYVPHQGSWTMQYGPLVCGSTPINAPINTALLSVTGGGPVPMLLSFSGTPSSLVLNQSFGTNIYSGYPNMLLGTATDVATGLPFQVIGNWNVTALSDSLLMGTLSISGTNGCSGATLVQFENG